MWPTDAQHDTLEAVIDSSALSSAIAERYVSDR